MKRCNACGVLLVAVAALLDGCGSVSTKMPDAGTTDATESDDDAAPGDDADMGCTAGEASSCTNDTLVRCKDDGSGEESVACPLGCHDTDVRCNDVDPSNALAAALDQSAAGPALDLGSSATIDTSTGQVTVDGTAVTVASSVVGTSPPVRVFAVASLVAAEVNVTGTSALAIVSNGDIKIAGHFSLSATSSISGPGALNNATCEGKTTITGTNAYSGAGGGGFGTSGGRGGNVNNTDTGSARNGGAAGGVTGNVTLTPLRGGCDGGIFSGNLRGRGGGAVQLVSRTKLVIEGILSANGSSAGGGGSGGGILLEAPIVQVSGNVVANGGAGAGGGLVPKVGEHGRTDNQPAIGATGVNTDSGNGGNGAAGAIGATNGQDKTVAGLVFGGHGGGGVGRIRVNTAANGFTSTGIISPNPSTGNVGTR